MVIQMLVNLSRCVISLIMNSQTLFIEIFDDFFEINSGLESGLQIFEEFLVNNYLMISPSFEDYIKGNKPLKRQLIVISIRIVGILVGLRYLLSILTDNKTIANFVCNGFHLIGNETIISVLNLSIVVR